MIDVAAQNGSMTATLVKTVSTEAPEPGVYPGVPAEEYHAWDAASNSRLGKILRSPAHLKAYLDDPPADTASQILGRAAHSAVLEPDKFGSDYFMIPKPEGRLFTNKDGSPSKSPANTAAYKEAVAIMEADHPDATGLKAAYYEECLAMREAVHAHPKVAKMIQATGRAELSIVWVDEKTGVTCKARLDWHTPTHAGGAIVDLKTTPDASPWAFAGSANKWGYYRQGATYLRGAEAVGLPAVHFAIIAVEKRPDAYKGGFYNGVILYRLREDDVILGGTQLDFALAMYAECERTGIYPGYTTEVVDLVLPGHAGRDIERNMEEATL